MKWSIKPMIMWSQQAKYDTFMGAFTILLALTLYLFMR